MPIVADEFGTFEFGTFEFGTFEFRTFEFGTFEFGTFEFRTFEFETLGFGKLGTGKLSGIRFSIDGKFGGTLVAKSESCGRSGRGGVGLAAATSEGPPLMASLFHERPNPKTLSYIFVLAGRTCVSLSTSIAA
jgi:hypothetical protein